MELRQLRYFVKIVENGSIGRAALELGLVQSALSQQISRLEGELATRLLQRTTRGVTPTEAGLAFFREAQLTLRHAEQAARAARQARLSGSVSIGFAPTTAAVVARPFMQAMLEAYPEVRLHLVESLSGHLGTLLNARELDLAVLFEPSPAKGLHVTPLLQENLVLIQARRQLPRKVREPAPAITTRSLAAIPLILPSGTHGLRRVMDAVFRRASVEPRVVAEIDSLAMLMDAVDAGLGATVQPGAATGRYPDAGERFHLTALADAEAVRRNVLCSLSDDELSPPALAARVVLTTTVRALVEGGRWPNASLLARAGHHGS